jgi:glycine dehydrogenase
MSETATPAQLDSFAHRHIGPREHELVQMLALLGQSSLDTLARAALPRTIFDDSALALPEPLNERDALARLAQHAARNQRFRSYLGMGYSDCIVPPVVQRNILENPGWYTQYTPYQAEISQGRLEALLNFQTMVADLTGLPLANASLLDEGTAAAEAMYMCRAVAHGERSAFFVVRGCHPQTVAVLATRAEPLGIRLIEGDAGELDAHVKDVFGAIVQYPATDGSIEDHRALAAKLHAAGALLVMAADPLALTVLAPPGELGADIAVGCTQRFGVPLGFGGPHAAYLATREEFKRHIPGRVVGVSRDVNGLTAYRLAIQTREQHIRRDKATSNICTAQVLLAIMASMYVVHHGPAGLIAIAERVRALTAALRRGLQELGHDTGSLPCFDTLRVRTDAALSERIVRAAEQKRINLRRYEGGELGIALDETTTLADVRELLALFSDPAPGAKPAFELGAQLDPAAPYPAALARTSAFLTHEVWNRYHAEHELLRYIHRLQAKDLSLTTSMIPLGSCTMKLNATSEMLPVSWPALAGIHPFAPATQTAGYAAMMSELRAWLAEITGFAAVSLQPNAGSQGEYAGLLVIHAYHRARGQGQRNVCLIPKSAHGTNPASAVVAGFGVVVVECDQRGNIDIADLRAKVDAHRERLGALMVTYPSTHGVFETGIVEICEIVHAAGGQVYMDGANMNALVGLCRPARFGADVCHLNLHKTFCIPHGGGGPGMGPIAVAPHLAPFLPGHPVSGGGGEQAIGPVSAAANGSAGILPIPWMYIAMMGAPGLKRATQVAILNANYMAARLRDHYRVVYTGDANTDPAPAVSGANNDTAPALRGGAGLVAHEFIIDARPFKQTAGVEVEDIAKRLMDYGFHAPTMSFPVAGTLMIEPTESESKVELDRLCDALIAIREEIRRVERGELDREDNPLKNAPHPARVVIADDWSHAYTRKEAAYPAPWLAEHKYWPPVSRVDNAYGDRNLVCTCLPPEAYSLGT